MVASAANKEDREECYKELCLWLFYNDITETPLDRMLSYDDHVTAGSFPNEVLLEMGENGFRRYFLNSVGFTILAHKAQINVKSCKQS